MTTRTIKWRSSTRWSTSNQTLYDQLGRAAGSIDPLGMVSRSYFDAVGNDIADVGPERQPERKYGYDANNQQVTQIDALGKVATTIFDAVGNGHGDAGTNSATGQPTPSMPWTGR